MSTWRLKAVKLTAAFEPGGKGGPGAILPRRSALQVLDGILIQRLSR